MNKENMQRAIAMLEATPDKNFRMDDYLVYTETPSREADTAMYVDQIPDDLNFDCGTSACIAGSIVVNFRDETPREGLIFDAAQEWLGLNDDQARHLFLGKFADYGRNLGRITKPEAIDAMKEMLENELAGRTNT